MFLGCPSVSVCVCASLCEFVRLCFRARVLLARYRTNRWAEFHQTLVDDVIEAKNKLTGF